MYDIKNLVLLLLSSSIDIDIIIINKHGLLLYKMILISNKYRLNRTTTKTSIIE